MTHLGRKMTEKKVTKIYDSDYYEYCVKRKRLQYEIVLCERVIFCLP